MWNNCTYSYRLNVKYMADIILLWFTYFPFKLSQLNLHRLEVVGRGSETQFQVGEN